jgi:hypothetical protein
MNSTYSFLDLSGAMVTPVGAYIFTGEGIGDLTVSMLTDRTVHDTGADGSIMVSKIAGNNGSITINVQQTSNLHKFLLKWFNAMLIGDTALWAASSILLRNVVIGTSHICTGISPQKVPDNPYQSQVQRVSWTLMCADIQNVPM